MGSEADVIRAADEEDRRIWREARRQSVVASSLRGAWGVIEGVAFLVGGGGDVHDDVPLTETGAGAIVAEVPVGTLAGDARNRILGPDPSRLPTALRGTLSFPPDGLLWQPRRREDRGILVRDGTVEAVATGLPGHGVLVHLTDGRIGFKLRRSDHDQVVAALEARYGKDT